MRILIINPPHESIGSRMAGEILPPLGLLSVGGPLLDDGHVVTLVDADVDNLPLCEIVERAAKHRPETILIGHNGSTSAHPIVVEFLPMIRDALPDAVIVYGGVFPTYHWREALTECPDVDVIIRGEGEETTRRVVAAIASFLGGAGVLSEVFSGIPGIAYRDDEGCPVASAPAPMLRNLDDYRVGWELIDHARYSYYGGMRGVVIQFSRGCPHLCTFCGQRGFWTQWRHRDPQRLAKEIGRLHREHGVRLINFADENPTTSKRLWRQLLEAIIAENCDLTIIATIRADDIVRDADILHLYRKAGFSRILIGMEHIDQPTLEKVKKGGTTASDREAIRLLRNVGILSLCSFVSGFEDATDRDYWRAYRQLIAYDPDQIIALYVTPHRWTPFFRAAKDRQVVQLDRKRWDYRHQVLASHHLPPWRTFLWVKLIEMLVQARPKALWRTYFNPDKRQRHGMSWYSRVGRRVWLHEVWSFLFRDRRTSVGPSLQEFWGEPQDEAEKAMHGVHQKQKMTVREAA